MSDSAQRLADAVSSYLEADRVGSIVLEIKARKIMRTALEEFQSSRSQEVPDSQVRIVLEGTADRSAFSAADARYLLEDAAANEFTHETADVLRYFDLSIRVDGLS